ncbi:MFS transporter [Francisellaceae bacterium]|nr:MFS transporter [Francisellaceae bacterium]
MISYRARRSLDWVNFTLADVGGGIGPFLSIYLLTDQHWSAGNIGLVLMCISLAGLVFQTPAGALVDKTKCKRMVLIIASLISIITTLVIILHPYFYSIIISQTVMGATSCIFGPLIAAITLGMAGHKIFPEQVGRNQAFNHAGNVFAAVTIGLMGYYISNQSVFYMIMVMALISIFLVLAIPKNEINDDIARGFDEADISMEHNPSSIFQLLKNKTLIVFIFSIMLFHFANAAMLPLVGQKISLGNQNMSMILMSACIVVAQLTMLPVAIFIGKKADKFGRKPLFLLAFLSLPLRGIIFAYIDNPVWLVVAEVLDGIGAGIFGVLFLIVLADITEGTGRYNLSQGLATTMVGVGASLSTYLSGLVVDSYGYDFAFGFLTVVAIIGLVVYFLFVPETKQKFNKLERG